MIVTCISSDMIADFRFDARAIADLCGPALSPYLLTAEALRATTLQAPDLAVGPGALLGLLVWGGEFVRSPDEDGRGCTACLALRRAFALPLRWTRGQPHDPRLPLAIAAAADQAMTAIRVSGWRIGLGEELQSVDLSTWAVTADSLAVPLIAALAVAERGGASRGHVLSTGRWTGKRVATVRGIRDKVATAVAMVGSLAEAVLFVPAENYAEASEAAAGRIRIAALDVVEESWSQALGPLLAELRLPPSLDAPLDERLAYANDASIRAHRPGAVRKYYQVNLLHDLARELRRRSRQEVDRLALALSYSHELCLMLLWALRPRHALLIATERTGDLLDVIEAGCPPDVHVECEVITSLPGIEEVHLVRSWLQDGDPDGCRCVEITAGNKPTTAMLIHAAADSGAGVLYLAHEMGRDNQPQYGTEKLHVLS